MSEWEIRFATPEDAPLFAEWIVKNPQIYPEDVADGTKEKNPTSQTFVVTHNGKPVWFAPMYLQFHLAHLGVNPESDSDERKDALKYLLTGIMGFALEYGIREITTMTKDAYPVAVVAKRMGFKKDPQGREQFKLNIGQFFKSKE
jgi:hypothetical protein